MDITDTGSDSIKISQNYGLNYQRSIPLLVDISDQDAWISNRFVFLFKESSSSSYFFASVLSVKSGSNQLLNIKSNGSYSANTFSKPVMPVVSLKTDVQLESNSKFYTETATATVTVAQQDTTHTFEHNTWSFK